MKQTIEIEVPDGKKAVWEDNKIMFKDIKPPLPKTWEEFCEHNKINENEYYLNISSNAMKSLPGERYKYTDRNILPNKQATEQHLALMQLHQLRDCYRQGWLPNESVSAHIIERYYDPNIGVILKVIKYYHPLRFLSFQTEERATEFLTNFHELIEQAGDLI